MVQVFVVLGEEVEVDVFPGMPLGEARSLALQKAKATSRPAEDWEIVDSLGYVRRSNSLIIASEGRMFLSLPVGSGA